MIWRLWVWTTFWSNLGCVILLSKLDINKIFKCLNKAIFLDFFADTLIALEVHDWKQILTFQSASPALVELEMIVMDWVVKSMDLPHHFLHGVKGGGVRVVSYCFRHFLVIKYVRPYTNSQGKGKVAICDHQADCPFHEAYCLIWWFGNKEYGIVLHDTECCHWDHKCN